MDKNANIHYLSQHERAGGGGYHGKNNTRSRVFQNWNQLD